MNNPPNTEHTELSREDLELKLSMAQRQVKILSDRISTFSSYTSELEVQVEVLSQMLQNKEADMARLVVNMEELKKGNEQITPEEIPH